MTRRFERERQLTLDFKDTTLTPPPIRRPDDPDAREKFGGISPRQAFEQVVKPLLERGEPEIKIDLPVVRFINKNRLPLRRLLASIPQTTAENGDDSRRDNAGLVSRSTMDPHTLCTKFAADL